jgi:hypothetical protein
MRRAARRDVQMRSQRIAGREPRRRKPEGAGIETLEHAFNLVLWAVTRRTEITVEQIQERYSCSRATAYRWHGVLAYHAPRIEAMRARKVIA